MRLVDAEPIEKFITDGLNNKDKPYGWIGVEILTEVHYAPTVDVELVIHAHWDCYKCSRFLGWKDGEPEPRWADGKFYCCSRCRRRTVIRENYCPSCGAKMDEEVKE